MKIFLSALLLFTTYYQCCAQQRTGYIMWPYSPKDKIEFTETINPPFANADSLYILAKSFVNKKYKTERDTITINDQRRTVVCKGTFNMPIDELGEKGKGYIGFTLTISCHYRGYRYTITDLAHYAQNPDGAAGGPLENDRAACGGSVLPMRYWNNEKSKTYYYIQTTIESLKESMSKHYSEG